jgi:hypothetical protein
MLTLKRAVGAVTQGWIELIPDDRELNPMRR